MYKINTTLLYNEDEFCSSKTKLLNFVLTLLLACDICGARLESPGLIFSGDTPLDWQLITLLSSYSLSQ